jgi:type VI secretion system protein ImpJ
MNRNPDGERNSMADKTTRTIAADARQKREPKVPDAIRWYDGMPLAPQHFQESSRRVDRVLDYHLGKLAPYHYGVVSLKLDGVSSGTLVVGFEAVLPDGAVVSSPTNGVVVRLDPADLRKKAGGKPGGVRVFNVYCALPRDRAGKAATGDAPRYLLPSDGDMVADDTTGENLLEVQRLVPNVQILVDVKDPTPDASWICLAQIQLDGDAFSSSTTYIPPWLEVSRDCPLWALCSALVDDIRKVANRLGEQINVLTGAGDAALVEESRRQIFYLTASLLPFESMLATGHAQPFPLYLALAGIVGQLSPLSRSPVPQPLLGYSHEALYDIFTDAAERVRRTIREGIQQAFKPHAFIPEDGVFGLDFVSDWADRPVLLTVRAPRGGDLKQVLQWMQGAIVGPRRTINDLLASRALGVRRDQIPRKETFVPTSDEVLFELTDLRRFITGDEPFVVWNPAKESEEMRPAELVLYTARKDW